MSELNVYQALTLLPDPEISPYFIWQKLYTQLHIALADINNQHGVDSVGVSFPGYVYEEKNNKAVRATLGNQLRVFAPNREVLATLDLRKWLSQLSDYVHIKNIAEVGQVSRYMVVQRYRAKRVEKQAETFAAHKQLSFDEALRHCIKHKRATKDYPFIRLRSLTNGHEYQLAIYQTEAKSPSAGVFNRYGMNNFSNSITVPHW